MDAGHIRDCKNRNENLESQSEIFTQKYNILPYDPINFGMDFINEIFKQKCWNFVGIY